MHVVRIYQRLSDRWKRERERLYRFQGRELLHYLHIGKTGGTAIKHALGKYAVARERVIILHTHGTRLRDIPLGEKTFFFLRDPVSRFISGFLSRQRKGRPHFYMPWTRQEEIAFKRFDSPEVLGFSLGSSDPETREAAVSAMNGIGHVRHSYRYWLESEEYLMKRRNDILLVGFQENLDVDFDRLRNRLHIPEGVSLPKEDCRANRNPQERDPSLTPEARRNLKKWYKEDYCLLERIREMFSVRI